LPDPERPPPGPFRPTFWRSPLRGPWLTSLLGLLLLIAIPLIAVTGFLSNDAYNPSLAGNSVGRTLGPLDFYLFNWPTHPSWLYAFTQGTHVTIGLAATPILLFKLWSVIPKLFEWPPAPTPAHALERLSLAFLVGGALFEFATGILDIQYAYLFKFFFTNAHYYGAWIFTVAFIFHAAIKLPTMKQALATRRGLQPLMDNLAQTRPEPQGRPQSSLIAPAPAAPTMSRRALIGTMGAGSLFLFIQGAGDTIGGPLRALAIFGPRDRAGAGPNGFAVNRTAAAAQITPEQVGGSWELELTGAGPVVKLTREQLLAMPQHTYDLAELAGVRGAATVRNISIETDGVFTAATLSKTEIADERTLLALKVNGVDLSLDHGYPARIIGPALPGVHCTKWVSKMQFAEV
jgi:DMSO/TMAO reductase YedYZ molybdopterin-dependent catalytic subunit